MDQTVYTTASSAAIEAAILSLPQRAQQSGTIVNAVMTRIGLAILAHIKKAFIAKSTGGTDEAGDRWAPLSPKTIAARLRKRGKTQAKQPKAAKHSKAQATKTEKWRKEYIRGLKIFKGNKAAAARRAWLVVGKSTIPFDKYNNNRVDILRDTGKLLNSLSPDGNSPDRILRVSNGTIIVGTRVKYALAHHRGVPGRLPQRRLWPKVFPASWWKDILAQGKQELVDLLTQLIKNAR